MNYLNKYEEFINEAFISHKTGMYDVNEDKVVELKDLQLYYDNIKVSRESNYIETKEYKELKNFLAENKNGYIRMYHGTGKSVPILDSNDKGLMATTAKTKKSIQSETGYVYLSVYPASAKLFAEIAYPYDKPVVVYEVVIPISELKPDLDQLNNMRRSYPHISNTLIESLVIGNGARVKGNIPKYMIDLYKGSY